MSEAAAGAEVVTLGECLLALVASSPGPLAESGTFERHIAGAEANVAVGLARLGHRVAYIGRVGADGFGTAIIRRLRGEGVDVGHLTVDPAPTGVMIRERRAVGPAQVLYYRTASAGSRLDATDVDAAAADRVFEGARWLHITGITPALSASARAAVERAIAVARERNLTVSLDLNLRRRLWSETEAARTFRDLASRVDMVMGDEDEVRLTTGTKDSGEALAKELLALGPSTAVVKLGADGAVAATSKGTIRVPALPVAAIVDPVGAGDAFAAGVIAAHLKDEPLERALAWGCACAAAALATVGDMAGLPDRAELERLLAVGGADTLR
ncbi:MAG: sugar kinase [Chloroflexota bacterium]|nr:sugar kinase [Chloroflexota bacterium]